MSLDRLALFSISAAVVLGAACVTAPDNGGSNFGRAESDAPVTEEPQTEVDPSLRLVEPSRDRAAPTGDPDDEAPTPEPEEGDPTCEPPAEDGWDWDATGLLEVGFMVDCTFLSGPLGMCWAREDEAAQWTLLPGDECGIDAQKDINYPELEPCLSEGGGEFTMQWTPDGHIVFGADWVHELDAVPTVPDRWIGLAFLSGDLPPACSDAIRELGFDYPFAMVMSRIY